MRAGAWGQSWADGSWADGKVVMADVVTKLGWWHLG